MVYGMEVYIQHEDNTLHLKCRKMFVCSAQSVVLFLLPDIWIWTYFFPCALWTIFKIGNFSWWLKANNYSSIYTEKGVCVQTWTTHLLQLITWIPHSEYAKNLHDCMSEVKFFNTILSTAFKHKHLKNNHG